MRRRMGAPSSHLEAAQLGIGVYRPDPGRVTGKPFPAWSAKQNARADAAHQAQLDTPKIPYTVEDENTYRAARVRSQVAGQKRKQWPRSERIGTAPLRDQEGRVAQPVSWYSFSYRRPT